DISLKNLIDLHIKSKCDIVGSKLTYTNTNKLQHAGVIFGKTYGNMPYHFRHGEEVDKYSNINRYFQAVTAAVSLITAKSFKDVGGLDPGYKWAFEDIDLSLKIGNLKNKNVIYCGNTNISHDESFSLQRNPVNKLFLSKNVKYFKDKWVGKYELDHEKYLKDKMYNAFKV